ncbi:hypothetical protein PENDEC_c023G04610 [Penicillium decumbens]|uniref:Trafficking protein particle complex subunit n=1 Tax=Penicillium decumbens TaxID=69771 RepID=A0A1V6P0H0_PENDC|nr:hypothetical protein PENDEC_c023G04610 [Penicillium decumbens]
MTVYSFYIFDRHAECIYKRRWLPRPTSIVGKPNQATGAGPAGLGQTVKAGDDDAKLVFGTVFSLRNMVRKLGGDEDNFISYSTSQYKLHYYETPTNIKFVMLTDLKSPSMRIALQQIYINLFVEYVVKNPLSPVEHPGGVGVNNELFEESLEQFVRDTSRGPAFNDATSIHDAAPPSVTDPNWSRPEVTSLSKRTENAGTHRNGSSRETMAPYDP